MITKWETERERIFRGSCISAKKKLEGIRLINELADTVLSKRQKLIRHKLRRGF